MNDQKKSVGFSPIYNDIYDNELRHLPFPARCLYLCIARLIGPKKGPVPLTVKTILDAAGMAYQAFLRARKTLIHKNLISVRSEPNRATYMIRLRPDVQESQHTDSPVHHMYGCTCTSTSKVLQGSTSGVLVDTHTPSTSGVLGGSTSGVLPGSTLEVLGGSTSNTIHFDVTPEHTTGCGCGRLYIQTTAQTTAADEGRNERTNAAGAAFTAPPASRPSAVDLNRSLAPGAACPSGEPAPGFVPDPRAATPPVKESRFKPVGMRDIMKDATIEEYEEMGWELPPAEYWDLMKPSPALDRLRAAEKSKACLIPEQTIQSSSVQEKPAPRNGPDHMNAWYAPPEEPEGRLYDANNIFSDKNRPKYWQDIYVIWRQSGHKHSKFLPPDKNRKMVKEAAEKVMEMINQDSGCDWITCKDISGTIADFLGASPDNWGRYGHQFINYTCMLDKLLSTQQEWNRYYALVNGDAVAAVNIPKPKIPVVSYAGFGRR